MRLDELICKIDPQTKVAIRIDQVVSVGLNEEFYCEYGGMEEYQVEEIEPDGYTDGDGISYLLIHAYDSTKVQQNDELPFPLEES
jgi:hypothetical protein